MKDLCLPRLLLDRRELGRGEEEAFLVDEIRQNVFHCRLPFGVLTHLGPLRRAMGKVVVRPDEDDRIERP
jgi:hypothetical protein